MHTAKRKRHDATALTLSKPFRSPLRVTSKSLQSAIPDAKKDHADNQATIPVKTEQIKAVPTQSATQSSSRELEEEQNITEVQKEYASLSQQLRKLRHDLDAVEQAQLLQATGQEEKLNRAILKWRDIARDAADEVFESASNRVRDMGGLQAWQKNSTISSSQTRFSDGYGVTEEQPSSDVVHDFDGNTTNGRPQGVSLTAEEDTIDEEKEEQFFTMDIMLQQLNIDPDLLGFDIMKERWLD